MDDNTNASTDTGMVMGALLGVLLLGALLNPPTERHDPDARDGDQDDQDERPHEDEEQAPRCHVFTGVCCKTPCTGAWPWCERWEG
jgi:hypothetical protein